MRRCRVASCRSALEPISQPAPHAQFVTILAAQMDGGTQPTATIVAVMEFQELACDIQMTYLVTASQALIIILPQSRLIAVAVLELKVNIPAIALPPRLPPPAAPRLPPLPPRLPPPAAPRLPRPPLPPRLPRGVVMKRRHPIIRCVLVTRIADTRV